MENFYYMDKTRLIANLLGNWGKVNLFTRRAVSVSPQYKQSMTKPAIRGEFEQLVNEEPVIKDIMEAIK